MDQGYNTPDWIEKATPGQAFLKGVIGFPVIPTLFLMSSFIGFGALAREVGLSSFESLFVTFTVFALPGQVILADQIGRGATTFVAFFAVMLTAIRLLPLAVSLLPLIRHSSSPRWLTPLLLHFVAVTVWVESMRLLPQIPQHLRMPYYAGFSLVLFIATLLGTYIGFEAGKHVPVQVSAMLLFITPVYFFISLLLMARYRIDYVAIVAGALLGPVFYKIMPGFDLLFTGVIGGSIAYAAGRLTRASNSSHMQDDKPQSEEGI